MFAYRRILVPTDFSASADQALLHALELVRTFDADLHLLHVDVGPVDRGRDMLNFPLMEEVIMRMRETLARSLRRGSQPGRAWPSRVRYAVRRRAAVAPAIVNYAREYAVDLIVMGVCGQTSPDVQEPGHVTEAVVRMAPCPVSTVVLKEVPRKQRIMRVEEQMVEV